MTRPSIRKENLPRTGFEKTPEAQIKQEKCCHGAKEATCW
jgi:hypothetical protein